MKIRTDFVTNSSSSSFVIVYEVKEDAILFDAIKEQLGEVGVQLCKKYFKKGEEDDYAQDYLEDDFDPNKTYFSVTHYTYSNDPDDFTCHADEIFIEQHLSNVLTQVYESE